MKNTKPARPTETQHPSDHLHQLLAPLVPHDRRPEPAHTTLALAELLQPARHTIAQLGSLLGRLTFPACAYRLFQRAFRRLFEPCLAALPPNEPLRVILYRSRVQVVPIVGGTPTLRGRLSAGTPTRRGRLSAGTPTRRGRLSAGTPTRRGRLSAGRRPDAGVCRRDADPTRASVGGTPTRRGRLSAGRRRDAGVCRRGRRRDAGVCRRGRRPDAGVCRRGRRPDAGVCRRDADPTRASVGGDADPTRASVGGDANATRSRS